MSNLKHGQPEDPGLHMRYCETLKQYKNTFRSKKQNYTYKTKILETPLTKINSGTCGTY